jgi:hypothetical protein
LPFSQRNQVLIYQTPSNLRLPVPARDVPSAADVALELLPHFLPPRQLLWRWSHFARDAGFAQKARSINALRY